MTLAFSEQINNRPTYFPEKIWDGLLTNKLVEPIDYVEYEQAHKKQFARQWDILYPSLTLPKLHTIREDASNRWRPGMDIHMVINNRTKNRFQFAPVVKCVSVQTIEIQYFQYMGEPIPNVIIDNIEYTYDPYFQFSDTESCDEIKKLAINDGFESVEDFFAYFDKDCKMKLIHWTDLKY